MQYGVNSKHPANTKLTNGYNLFEWVMRMSTIPSFWGRHLTGKEHLTLDEIKFLHERHCGIALIFNEISETDVSKSNGVMDGLRAANAAKTLLAPTHKNIALFVELNENWSINHNWMISYANAVIDSGYLPGFIANTDSSKNFNFGRQCSHYVQAMRDIARSSTAYWATEPKLHAEPSVWGPYCPSQLCPEDIDIWEMDDTIRYGTNIRVTKNYIQNKSNAKFIWHNNY